MGQHPPRILKHGTTKRNDITCHVLGFPESYQAKFLEATAHTRPSKTLQSPFTSIKYFSKKEDQLHFCVHSHLMPALFSLLYEHVIKRPPSSNHCRWKNEDSAEIHYLLLIICKFNSTHRDGVEEEPVKPREVSVYLKKIKSPLMTS